MIEIIAVEFIVELPYPKKFFKNGLGYSRFIYLISFSKGYHFKSEGQKGPIEKSVHQKHLP